MDKEAKAHNKWQSLGLLAPETMLCLLCYLRLQGKTLLIFPINDYISVCM